MLVAKHHRPDVVAVVLADEADHVLKREAASIGATYIVRPDSEEDLAQSVVDVVSA